MNRIMSNSEQAIKVNCLELTANNANDFKIVTSPFLFPGRARAHAGNHSSAVLHGSLDGKPQTHHACGQRRHRQDRVGR